MSKKYQTIADFVSRPFRKGSDVQKDSSYGTKYTELVRTGNIKIKAVTVVEDSYYYHITIPSESQKDQVYDVVIRFFTEDPAVVMETHLNNYYIQFFSNSPGFMYHYAYIYHKEGYLIEALYDKLDADYIDTPPSKTNPNMVISYDKSIYCAIRFLNETKFRNLTKNGTTATKVIPSNKFFSDISDFQSVKFDQAVASEEKKLTRELERKGGTGFKSKIFSRRSDGKIKAGTSTVKDRSTSITVVKKKTGTAKVIAKKRGRKTTARK